MRPDDVVRTQCGRGSYIPVLMKAFYSTGGPVLELGAGYISTPMLHWMCFNSNRRLDTFESNPMWARFAQRHVADHHRVFQVSNWDDADLSGQYSVALVDHSPEERRILDVARLQHVDYVVLHDTERRRGRRMHKEARAYFKHDYRYDKASPSTSVFSNKHDLAWLST